MRYLVTGAGMIGSAIAERLSADHDVTVLDLEERPVPAGVRLVRGDLRDLDGVRRAVGGVDGVFHTAALHGIHLHSHSATDFMQVNVQGTFNVLEASSEAGITHVVHSSTVGVFGKGAAAGPDGFPATLRADTPRLPNDNYGNSKVLCEQLCDFYTRARGMKIVALRYGAVRQLIEQLATFGLAHALSGTVTDLADAVEANLRAMERVDGLERLAYNILPTTLFDADALRAAGANYREALLAKVPSSAAETVPNDPPRPAILHDAAETETALGMRMEHDQAFFVSVAK